MTEYTIPDQRDKLARMAGQIAGYFGSYPEEKAVTAIADHINQFWHRRMRTQFVTEFRQNTSGLPPLVARSLPLIRE